MEAEVVEAEVEAEVEEAAVAEAEAEAEAAAVEAEVAAEVAEAGWRRRWRRRWRRWSAARRELEAPDARAPWGPAGRLDVLRRVPEGAVVDRVGRHHRVVAPALRAGL